MHGFGRMQEDGGGAGAAQGGDDFPGDVAALADAGYDHFPGMPEDQLDGANQLAVQPGGGAVDGFRFDFHGSARSGEPSVLEIGIHGSERERASIIA